MKTTTTSSKVVDILHAKLNQIRISGHQLKKAKSLMKTEKFTETMIYQVNEGVRKDKLAGFTEVLLKILKLDEDGNKDQIRAAIEMMNFSPKPKSWLGVEEIFVDSLKIYLVATQGEEDTIDFAWYAHRLHFEPAQQSQQKAKFDEVELKIIKRTLHMYCALEYFKAEGVIKKICICDSDSDSDDQ